MWVDRGEYRVSDDRSLLDFELIHAFLARSYWSAAFAYLMDVFVLEPFRGQGLARWMVFVPGWLAKPDSQQAP